MEVEGGSTLERIFRKGFSKEIPSELRPDRKEEPP